MTSSPKPLFSVVIPVYNGEKYLCSAIQSVLDLGYEALELIVVDDGSTDVTADIISSFADRVRYVSQPSSGPAAARNRGLQCARGKVIGFLDADDLWTSSLITRALVRLAQTHIEEAKRWYQRAHERNPDDPEIYHEALALRPIDPDLCIQLADALVTRNQPTRAIFFYQLALQVRPDDVSVLIKLAKVLRREKEPEQAIASCRRAVTLAANQGTYHILLGDLLADQGQFDEAAAAYQRAGELEATSAEIHKRLGDLFARQGRIDEASAAYERAIELGYKSY
jgi:glycosyltransferase involved in cell wall biosynthesis